MCFGIWQNFINIRGQISFFMQLPLRDVLFHVVLHFVFLIQMCFMRKTLSKLYGGVNMQVGGLWKSSEVGPYAPSGREWRFRRTGTKVGAGRRNVGNPSGTERSGGVLACSHIPPRPGPLNARDSKRGANRVVGRVEIGACVLYIPNGYIQKIRARQFVGRK